MLDGPDLLARRQAGWQRLLEEPGPRDVNLVAADDGGTIVGLFNAGPARDEDAGPATAEIMMIYATPGAWGTGVGRGLMTGGLDRLRSAGFGDVLLWVLDSNDRARRFYERAGFATDGATKDDVVAGTTIREIRYRRELRVGAHPD